MAKKLLDQLSDALRTKHYSYRTEETYLDWVRRFILFHHKKHPAQMGADEIRAYIIYLAAERNVAASTQNQALSAILFLYREVLHQEIEPILLTGAKRPERLPTVLTRDRDHQHPRPTQWHTQTHGADPVRLRLAPDGMCPPAR